VPTSTIPLFLQAGCHSCHPTNSVKALKANALKAVVTVNNKQFKQSQQYYDTAKPEYATGENAEKAPKALRLMLKTLMGV